MPTYEYECVKCGHKFEKFHGMMEKPVKRCPKCRHGVRKVIGTGAGIIFKGSGFYETDYRRKSAGKDKDAEPAKTEPAKKEKTGAVEKAKEPATAAAS